MITMKYARLLLWTLLIGTLITSDMGYARRIRARDRGLIAASPADTIMMAQNDEPSRELPPDIQSPAPTSAVINKLTIPPKAVSSAVNPLSVVPAKQKPLVPVKPAIVAKESVAVVKEPIKKSSNVQVPSSNKQSSSTSSKPAPTTALPEAEQPAAFDQDELVLPFELLPSDKLKQPSTLKPEAIIELNFVDADLTHFIEQIKMIFNIDFITDEMINPLPKGSPGQLPPKPIQGNKISFKTTKPLTKEETWSLFLTFLEIAGFAVVPEPDPGRYRIQTIDAAKKAPLPAYIGVDFTTLPDNDQLIRYVYFIENSTLEKIIPIVESLKSPYANLIRLEENKGFLITDKAYNIRTLMQIITELDQVSMPQAMSIIKLRHADAVQVQNLYLALSQTPDAAPRPFPARKQSTSLYFPESARIIAEPRTNSLIVLGQQDAIQKIEDFIIRHVDVELDQPFSPLFPLQLNFAQAKDIARIMTDVTKFGKATEVGRFGGVRAQDKFLGEMTFTAEEATNRIIIRGSYDDYLKAKEIIVQLDEQQPQVAVEVLILSMSITDVKALGVQLRNKKPGPDGLLGPNIDFQTSGIHTGPANSPVGIIENTTDPLGASRLLGNLLNAVTNTGVGNTIISLGRDVFGVWGILQLLQTMNSLQVLSNPYLIATNKTPATVSIGETRRVPSGVIIPGGGSPESPTFDNDPANLSVNITPQINSDGMITLTLNIEIDQFVNPVSNDIATAEKTTRQITSQVVVANKEVIAIGGLIRNTIHDNLSKVPVLGDIPIIGWLFKNRLKDVDRQNLLILISTRIIPADKSDEVNKFTQERILDYHGMLDQMHTVAERRDPIHKVFFEPQITDAEKAIDDFIFERAKKNQNSARNRRRQKQKNEVVVQQKKPSASPVTPPVTPKTVVASRGRPRVPMPQSPKNNHVAAKKPIDGREKNRLSLSRMDKPPEGSV